MNIHLPAILGFTRYQGFDPSPYLSECRAALYDLGMDQYLYIPFLGGWTSINPSYFDVNRRGTIGFDTLPFKYWLILISMFDTEFFFEHLWTLSAGFQPNSPKSPVLWLKWHADCSWSGDFCASERVQWCTIHFFWRSEIADHLMGHWFILHSNFWSLIGLKHPHWNGSKVYTLG